MFYLTTHSTHFIYGYMASDIWLRTILIERKETRCRHIGYSYRLTARVLLYAPSHRQDNTYHGLCYTSRGALAGTRNSSMGPRLLIKCWHVNKNRTFLFFLLLLFLLLCQYKKRITEVGVVVCSYFRAYIHVKVQACFPWHTLQISNMSGQDSGFVVLCAVHGCRWWIQEIILGWPQPQC